MSGAKPGAQEVTGERARSHDAAVAVFQRPNEEQAGRKEMSLQLFIPDSVTQAIRLPEKQMRETLLAELAITLYAQEALSFGKAKELAGMSRYEFGQILGKRGIPRHFGREELEDDLAYANRE